MCLKDRNVKSENFKLLACVKKKLLKKNPTRGGKSPPHPMHNRVKEKNADGFKLSYPKIFKMEISKINKIKETKYKDQLREGQYNILVDKVIMNHSAIEINL